MDIIDHGHGIKTKWDIKVHGKMPPNPPIEVRAEGPYWNVVQHRTERVYGQYSDYEDAVKDATTLAAEHKAPLILP